MICLVARSFWETLTVSSFDLKRSESDFKVSATHHAEGRREGVEEREEERRRGGEGGSYNLLYSRVIPSDFI